MIRKGRKERRWIKSEFYTRQRVSEPRRRGWSRSNLLRTLVNAGSGFLRLARRGKL